MAYLSSHPTLCTLSKSGRSDSCIELMKQLLHIDPAKRMTSQDLLRHPWIQGLTASWDEKNDKAYRRHLMANFRKHILKHFACQNSDNERVLREVFNLIDLAGNGVLDANEIRIALRSAGESEDVITKIVSSLHFQTHGGKVSGVTFDEFVRIMNEE